MAGSLGVKAEAGLAAVQPEVDEAEPQGVVAPAPATARLEKQPCGSPRQRDDDRRRRWEPLEHEAEERQREGDRTHAHAKDHERRSEDVHGGPDRSCERHERGAGLVGEGLRRDGSVDRKHEQAVEEDRRRLRRGAAPDERSGAGVAAKDELAAERDGHVPAVGGEDDAEDEGHDRRLERPTVEVRQLLVQQVVRVRVGEGEQREGDDEADVDRAHDERRGDRGVERLPTEVVQPDEEEERDPRGRWH